MLEFYSTDQIKGERRMINKSLKRSGVLLGFFILSIILILQFTSPDTIYRIFVQHADADDISSLQGYTGKIGQEDIYFGTGEDTDTFTVPTYSGSTITLTKLPTFAANAYSIIKGQWYVSASSSITDHGVASGVNYTAGNLKFIIDTCGANYHTVELPGNTSYPILTNLTVPANIVLDIKNGALLSPGAGVTLTIESPANIIAGRNQQIFSGNGSIVFTQTDGDVYLEYWGRNSDPGTTDMSSEFTKANATSCDIVLNNTSYYLPGAFSISSNLKGKNGTIIKVSSTTQMTLASGIKIENIIFECNSTDIAEKMVYVPEGSDNVKISNCVFQNANGTAAGTDRVYPIWVELDDVENLLIEGCVFDNISSVDDDGVVGAGGGFAGGIFFQSPLKSGATITNPISGTVRDCFFRNIYTEDSAFYLQPDSDGIRIYLYDSGHNAPDFRLRLINNHFIDVQKSCIKLSGTPGVEIDGVSNFVNRSDPDNIVMTAVVRAQFSRNCTIRNVKSVGKVWTVINYYGTDIEVDNVQSTPIIGQSGSTQNCQWVIRMADEDGLNDQNLTISNVRVEGAAGLITTVPLADGAGKFQNIAIRNVEMNNCINPAADDGFINLHGCTKVKLDNVVIRDTGSRVVNMIEFRDTSQVTISNSEFRCKSKGIICEQSSATLTSAIELYNTKWVRTDGTVTSRFLNFDNNGTAACPYIVIRNLDGTMPTLTTQDYSEFIFITGSDPVISDVKIRFTSGGGEYPKWGVVAIEASNNIFVSGISLTGSSGYGSTCAAVTISGTTVGRVSDIWTNMDGVYAEGATLQVNVDSVTHLSTRTGVAGGGTTVTQTDVTGI